MESKKVSKKLNTIFWYVIYSLPLLIFAIYICGYLAFYKETGAVPEFSIIDICIHDINTIFDGFTWGIVKDTLYNTFELIGFNLSGDITSFVIILFTWFVQFAFIHLFIDFLLFIPRLFHQFIERWS